ncbi:MAG: COP23 domain-containing protein [Cyanobacteria bacterium P01_G01_bin.19]
MKKRSYLIKAIFLPIALGTFGLQTKNVSAANSVEVVCDASQDYPTVTAVLSNPKASSSSVDAASRRTTILSFLPEYFSPEEANAGCQKTAQSLNGYYARGEMNYLASDTIDGVPVICAVERRGVSCNGYKSEILFGADSSINPSQLLYDMLGGNFKDSQIPSSRTVSRIYTDLRPTWWPF